MSKHKISFSLDKIDDAIQQIRDYQRLIDSKIDRLLKLLTDEGASVARASIMRYDARDVGDLFNSIQAVYLPEKRIGIIRTTSDHAAFVEFGTGIAGGSLPPEDVPPDWTYDVNGHGESGWWYFYPGGRHGPPGWRNTQGMYSRPFMWTTARIMESEIPKYIKEVFGR